jgi:hypothetical protein
MRDDLQLGFYTKKVKQIKLPWQINSQTTDQLQRGYVLLRVTSVSFSKNSVPQSGDLTLTTL